MAFKVSTFLGGNAAGPFWGAGCVAAAVLFGTAAAQEIDVAPQPIGEEEAGATEWLPLAVAILPDEGIALTDERRAGRDDLAMPPAPRQAIAQVWQGHFSNEEAGFGAHRFARDETLDLYSPNCAARPAVERRVFENAARPRLPDVSPEALSMPIGENNVCFAPSWVIARSDTAGDARFDVSFSPTDTICADGSCEGRAFSSRIELALENITDAEGAPVRGVYFFAGADDKALMWRPNARNGNAEAAPSNLRLNDTVTVGDIEAGITLMGEHSELSLSYISREVSYRLSEQQRLEANEDFVGIVWRRK